MLPSRAVTPSSLEREVRGSNLGQVKLDAVLPTAFHQCDISSKEAMLPGRDDAELGLANSFHASAYYIEYNERLDLIKFVKTESIFDCSSIIFLALTSNGFKAALTVSAMSEDPRSIKWGTLARSEASPLLIIILGT